MATVIREKTKRTGLWTLPESLRRILPFRLLDEIASLGGRVGTIEEIRLRREKAVSLTTPSENVMLRTVLDRMEIDAILQQICDGSLYAHSETICRGYVTLEDGIRVGLCGRAAVEGGRIIGVYGVTGMNIRIPARLRRLGEPICQLLRDASGCGGVLVYSPPGVGKTTLLRGVAAQMASGAHPWRVAVIDTRGEFAPFLDDVALCVDILAGYPKPEGIGIACRTLNAQLIVCDEIGDTAEAAAIVAAQNSGVPFVASAHASCVEGLLRRTAIRLLHDAHVFSSYVGIERKQGCADFLYTACEWEVADALLQDRGGGAPHR